MCATIHLRTERAEYLAEQATCDSFDTRPNFDLLFPPCAGTFGFAGGKLFPLMSAYGGMSFVSPAVSLSFSVTRCDCVIAGIPAGGDINCAQKRQIRVLFVTQVFQR